MYEFLTLAITETVPNTGEFTIIAMDLKSRNMGCFALSREQIISSKGDVYWDIGYKTLVGDLVETNDYYGNVTCTCRALKTAEKVNNFKKHLEGVSSGETDFFTNCKRKFTVIKVGGLTDITVKNDDNNTKHYVEVYNQGLSSYNKKTRILNKDYRWINYWNFAIKSGLFNEKKDRYLKLLNEQGKDVYFVLYKRCFSNGKNFYWIAGVHWL